MHASPPRSGAALPVARSANDRLAFYGNGTQAPHGDPSRVGVEPGKKTRARIRLASLNINGYGRPVLAGGTDKWLGVNQIMKERRLTVLAVQEAHLTEARLNALNVLFDSQLHVVASQDPNNATGSGGVAFVFSKKFLRGAEPLINEIIPGRAAMVTFPWSANKTLTVVNVYAPNAAAANAEFWDKLVEHFNVRGTKKPDVLMGDFNVVEDAADRMPVRNDAAAPVEAFARLRNCLGMEDTWRRAHPLERAYSFVQLSTGSQSRLDRIYVTRPLLPAAADWGIAPPGLPTDHQMVSFSLANYHAPVVGKGRWALPPSLLDDAPFVKIMKQMGVA